jgi:hypothetical protein
VYILCLSPNLRDPMRGGLSRIRDNLNVILSIVEPGESLCEFPAGIACVWRDQHRESSVESESVFPAEIASQAILKINTVRPSCHC